MKTDFHIRPARMTEADRIERLQQRSLLKLGTPYYGRAPVESFLRLAETLDTRLIRDRTYYVAEQDGELIGCGGWTFRAAAMPGEEARSAARLQPGRDAAFIRAVYVAPEHARQGVGSALISRAEAAASAAGFHQTQLIATLSGEPLYRSLGYREVGRLNVPLPDETVLPAVRMVKELAAASKSLAMLPDVA